MNSARCFRSSGWARRWEQPAAAPRRRASTARSQLDHRAGVERLGDVAPWGSARLASPAASRRVLVQISVPVGRLLARGARRGCRGRPPSAGWSSRIRSPRRSRPDHGRRCVRSRGWRPGTSRPACGRCASRRGNGGPTLLSSSIGLASEGDPPPTRRTFGKVAFSDRLDRHRAADGPTRRQRRVPVHDLLVRLGLGSLDEVRGVSEGRELGELSSYRGGAVAQGRPRAQTTPIRDGLEVVVVRCVLVAAAGRHVTAPPARLVDEHARARRRAPTPTTAPRSCSYGCGSRPAPVRGRSRPRRPRPSHRFTHELHQGVLGAPRYASRVIGRTRLRDDRSRSFRVATRPWRWGGNVNDRRCGPTVTRTTAPARASCTSSSVTPGSRTSNVESSASGGRSASSGQARRRASSEGIVRAVDLESELPERFDAGHLGGTDRCVPLLEPVAQAVDLVEVPRLRLPQLAEPGIPWRRRRPRH